METTFRTVSSLRWFKNACTASPTGRRRFHPIDAVFDDASGCRAGITHRSKGNADPLAAAKGVRVYASNDGRIAHVEHIHPARGARLKALFDAIPPEWWGWF